MLLFINYVSSGLMAWGGKSNERIELWNLVTNHKLSNVWWGAARRWLWDFCCNGAQLPRVLSSHAVVTFSSFCVFDLTEQLLKELFFHAWQFCFVTILKFPVNRYIYIYIVICMSPFQESEGWLFIADIVFYCIVLASVIIHLCKRIVNGMLCSVCHKIIT